MDKIQGIQPGKPVPDPKSGPSRRDDLFKETFNRVLEEQKGAEEATGAGPLGEIMGVTPPLVVSSPAEIVDQAETLLDLLDGYAEDLDDPSKTLRDLSPRLDEIRERTDLLSQSAAQADERHADLSQMARRVAMTAEVALFKFQRGDFV